MSYAKPQYSSRGYQSNVPSVHSVYGGNAAPRAPWATEESVNDAQPHNDIPNNSPLYHISGYERPPNNPPPVAPNPILQNEPLTAPHQSSGSRVAHSSPSQNWMSQHDSHLTHPRNAAAPGGLTSPTSPIKQLVEGSCPARPHFTPSEGSPSGVNPHSSPIQSWHASYDSSLNQHRRKADEDASSVQTTGGQGCASPSSHQRTHGPSGATGGQGGQQLTAHAVSHTVPPATWLSGFDSALTSPRCHSESRPGEGGYTSGVAELIQGGTQY